MPKTLAPKKKRLNKEELAAAEKELRKKYKQVIPGTLRNVSTGATHKGKRTCKIKCATRGCTTTRLVATSDLHQIRFCVDCTQEQRAERRRKKPRAEPTRTRPRTHPR